MTIPSVSIGLPVFNGETYLRQAIETILGQTYRDFELIISDNASTDGTERICRSFAEKDPRIRYSRNDANIGGAGNFNRVFELSRGGKYFQWACHDDVWVPTLLARCVAVMEKEPEVVLCHTKTTFIDENGGFTHSLIGRPDLDIPEPAKRYGRLLAYHALPNECNPVLGLVRADAVRKTGLHGRYPASDMILLAELALRGRFHEIPEGLFLRRNHPLTSVRANPKWEDRAVWFDPANRGKVQMPRWRWFFEWLKAVRRAPIAAAEKTVCLGVTCRWAWWNRRRMRNEIEHGLKHFLGRFEAVRRFKDLVKRRAPGRSA